MQPKQIGQFQIRRVIASGGMGTVYEGIQQNPRRTVAVKVITTAVATEEAAARLKYEAQMLARLHHPGIAEIYDAGTYDQDGKAMPFFAMEYIPNARSITGYASEKELGIHDRLKLFIEICEAVHHGHVRGIVHRDLKPANILVDTSGRVRIIDFGIARATDADIRRTSAFTEVGQLVGSAAYMSPEQFESDSRDIDTRSDVYALGVVLYELLTGVLPYDAKSKSIYEVAAMVREERPPLLGTHDKAMKGDLETIVDKALQKDRNERYESAHVFSEDIRRYISGEAITARTPSLTYHIRVLARRHKMAMGSVAAIFLVLIASVIVVSQLYMKVATESDRASAAQKFLTDALSAATSKGIWAETSVADMYDHVTTQLDSAFPGEPVMEAEVRQLIGLAYFGMSRFDEAEDQLSQTVSLRQSALGEYSDEARETMGHLQFLLSAAGRLRKREAVQYDIWQLQTHNYGADHESTLVARTNWIGSLQLSEVSKAVELAGETVQMWKNRYGDDHKKTVGAERSLAWHLLKAGRLNESEELARHSYERMKRLYSSDEGLVNAGRRTLAAGLVMLGRRDEAKELYEHRSLPKDMQIKQVLQGSFDPTAGGPQLLVFWEIWCPFCPRAFPMLEEVYRDFSDLGLNVVGLTRADGDSTGELARAFLRDKNISYANVQIKEYWKYFRVSGIPHVWIMHDRELVWEGNPLSTRGLWESLSKGLGLQDSSKVWGTKGRAGADG